MTASKNHQKVVDNFVDTLNDPFTNHVIDAMGEITPPRQREIFTSLIRHLHAFARDVDLLTPEWFEGVNQLNRMGQMSDEKRNEGVLVSDVFGLESLVDHITQTFVSAEGANATPSAILGPFYRENAPRYPNGADIVQKHWEKEETAYVSGHVRDAVTGEPLAGVELDIWHTSPDGLYEQQDPEQPEFNLRGLFTTDKNGFYAYKCLRPPSYPIPFDGPAGDFLKLTGRHPMRPGHIHWMVRKEGYSSLITQLYDRTDPYTKDDSVFAVKDALVIDYSPAPKEGGHGTKFELVYDITLAPVKAQK